jgi:hypothetical protein
VSTATAVIVVIDQDRIHDINHEHELCEASYGETMRHAIRCGELLSIAKTEIGHGQWLPWLEQNFEASERTAQTYMRLHRDFSDPQRVAGLQDTERVPSSIRAAIKELTKPKTTSKQDAQSVFAPDFVDDDPTPILPAGKPVEASWTDQHERKRRQILDILDDARGYLLDASKPGLQIVGIADLVRSAETRCRQAQARIGDLAFQFE